MYTASLEFIGSNYYIESSEINVNNMNEQIKNIQKFVKEHGGSNKGLNTFYHKRHANCRGYYNQLSFQNQFFLDGIIINLSGETFKNRTYLVDPFRRNFCGDATSKGICLSDLDEYILYDRNKKNGLREREPKLTDPGIIELTFEGSIKHLASNCPEFYEITGISQNWKPNLKLLSYDEFKLEQSKNKYAKKQFL